jgi:hypothetical protein
LKESRRGREQKENVRNKEGQQRTNERNIDIRKKRKQEITKENLSKMGVKSKGKICPCSFN